MSQTKQLDRDEGKGDALQASPVAILHFPVEQVLNLEVIYPYMCGCTYEKVSSGASLYVTVSSTQAYAGSEPVKWKNIMRKLAEDDAFDPGKLFIVLIFSALNTPS